MDLNYRPKLKIKRQWLANVLDIIGIVLIIGIIAYVIHVWPSLPEKIPMHYNASGEVDRWGGKGGLLVFLAIGIILWIPLSILERYPHVHNYTHLTEENVERLYKNSILLLNVIKNEVIILFAYFAWRMIQDAFGNTYSALGKWELPLVLIIIFGTIAIFVIRSFRLR